MTIRIKRKKKLFVQKLENNYYLVMQLLPLIYTQKTCVWLASLVVSKSKRQINDWLKKRKNKRAKILASSLTGKENNRIQAIAIQKLHQWIDEHPIGDSISFRCESAKPYKQFRVWARWFLNHEHSDWEISSTHRSFFYHKKSV